MRFRRKAILVLICLVILFTFILRFYEEDLVVTSQKREQGLYENSMAKSMNWKSTDDRPLPCKPVDHILFLKTHKTGSSTVTNILNRYGDKNDLLLALPTGHFIFRWPTLFRLTYADTFGRAPNILCNHARYNKAPMNWLFPKETTRYITILREPAQHFASIFDFFHLGGQLNGLHKVSSKLEAFLQNATFYFDQAKTKAKKVITLNLIKNPSLFDLGFDTKYHGNLRVVRNYIQFLQQEFDLVMLVEYFDESLVLLKRRFCWKIEDILYFKLVQRRENQKQNLTSKVKEQILKWNSGDALLYDVFNQTLWKMIEEEGPDFFKDLALFRKELESIKSTCLREGKFLTALFPGLYVQGYSLKPNISKELNNTCNKMIMNEIPFLNYLRDKMKRKFQTIDSSVNQQNVIQQQ